METVPWIAGVGLFGGVTELGFDDAWLGSGLSTLTLQGIFAMGVILALFISIGAAPRLSAGALWVASVLTYRATLPIATFDDYLSNVVTFGLMLLPPELPSRLRFGGRPAASVGGQRVPAASVSVCLLGVFCAYLAGGPSELSSPGGHEGLVGNAFRAIAIAFVVPVEAIHVAGIVAQLLLHTYLSVSAHVVFPNIVLGATAFLFWGETAGRESKAWVLDAATVVGVVAALTGVLGVGWAVVDHRSGPNPAIRLASTVGVFPSHALFPSVPTSALLIRVEDPSGAARTRTLDGSERHVRALISRLGGMPPGDPMGFGLAAAAARRFCRDEGYQGLVGTIWAGVNAEHRFLEFECGPGGSLARVR